MPAIVPIAIIGLVGGVLSVWGFAGDPFHRAGPPAATSSGGRPASGS
jgi:hypothetical protein